MFVCAGSLCLATPLGTAAAMQTDAHARGAPADPTALQAAFDQAAREFGVPERIANVREDELV